MRPLLEEAAVKSDEWDKAASDVTQSRFGYTGTAPDDALQSEVSRLTEEIGVLSDALEDDQRAEQLEGDFAVVTLESEGLRAELNELTKSIEELRIERERLVPVAAQSRLAEANAEQATDRHRAAIEAASVTEQLHRAQETQLIADKDLTSARESADRVLELFLHGQAAVIAETLVAGKPCAVCGSLEHPSPASFTGDPISQEDVDDAQAEVVHLEPIARTAKQKVESLNLSAAQLSAVAGAGDIDSLKAAAVIAGAELAAAEAAEKRVQQIDGELLGDNGFLAKRKDLEAASRKAGDQLAGLMAERTALSKKLTRLRAAYPTVNARYESLISERNAAHFLADAIARLALTTKQRTDIDGKLASKLKQTKFQTVDDVQAALLGEVEAAQIREHVELHAAATNENLGILKQPDLEHLPKDGIAETDAANAHRSAQEATRATAGAKANAETALKQLELKRAELSALIVETEELVTEYEILHRLTETMNGRPPNTRSMSLESYYLAAELEDVLSAANVRLQTLSQGRFEFHHTERGVRRAGAVAGLEIEVFDEYTGTARPANQLSGGQQFLASLALALGLAEVVTSRAGGIELNTLFVDEGFGGLSDEYLEIAMETLDSLKQGGRTVGVISHVASMQEQIGAQLQVVAEPGGPSKIVQEVV